MNEHRYTMQVNDRPAPVELCERRGVNAQMARCYNPIQPRTQPREVEIDELAAFVGRDRAIAIMSNPHNS